MLFVYLDEFGHIGPFVSRHHEKYRESPVFGLAGLVIPDQAVRSFSTYILQRKEETFVHDIAASRKLAVKWEKKGASFIRSEPMKKYPALPRLMFRMMRKLKSAGGGTFYYGREKRLGFIDGNPTGLYTTCLSHALRRIDAIAANRNEKFIVVLDEHTSRKELLECAAKTMFGKEPCRHLASPPFEVESYLDNNMQAADWFATLIGRMTSHEVLPIEYIENEYFHRTFSSILGEVSLGRTLERRFHRTQRSAGVPAGPFAGLKEMLDAKTGAT